MSATHTSYSRENHSNDSLELCLLSTALYRTQAVTGI